MKLCTLLYISSIIIKLNIYFYHLIFGDFGSTQDYTILYLVNVFKNTPLLFKNRIHIYFGDKKNRNDSCKSQ